ncbi:hypothetical protein [Chengkuizengella sediminis]|uniref:hypothetical protein n=1 Tax=Chengkuizengella sediminis TaxID=1885917 RepID=UPI00138A0982|nr:hypothetical protein [Chengkuizengella sediminis]NDI33916.1 hypothetical protein [Chengkuizengella sediminis]
MFEKSICDCCVCPMQFVLEQFRGEEVDIFSLELGGDIINFNIQITEVKNFIVSGIDKSPVGSDNPIHIPICNIFFVIPPTIPDVKPIQKNTKGECVCCEDPITNVANALNGKEVSILEGLFIIEKVGEGIVIGQNPNEIVVFSSCKISGIEEMTNGALSLPIPKEMSFNIEKSICDCCVCPMQFALEQFKGEEVFILSETLTSTIQIIEVNNFIVSGIVVGEPSQGNPIHIPICNILFVSPISTTRIPDVKPIQKNTKGECVCCEDPITNVANALIGKEVSIRIELTLSSLIIEFIIEKVGEGIVFGNITSIEPPFGSTIILSSCKIPGIEEMTNEPLSPPNLKERFVNFEKSICDCCVCPMQFALEQFRGEEIVIRSEFGGFNIQITEVKNFIVSGIDKSPVGSGNPIHIPICNIVQFLPISEKKIPDVKPIQKNTKGECVCCEDPTTNVANALIGKEVTFFNLTFIIEKVGEGIVIGQNPDLIFVFSSCKISGIEEMKWNSFVFSTEVTAQKSSRWNNLKQMSVKGNKI